MEQFTKIELDTSTSSVGHADGKSNAGGNLDFKVFGSNLWDETSTLQIETSKSKSGEKKHSVCMTSQFRIGQFLHNTGLL